MLKRVLRLVFACVTLVNAVPVAGAQEEERFYVYRDGDSAYNHGEFSNWMPAASGKAMRLSLVDNADPASGSTAIRVDVDLQPTPWCGIAAASKADYWGMEPGPAYDLSRASKLVFFAKGAKGGEAIQVKVAIAGDKRFGDSSLVPFATDWIQLGPAWKRYELPVDGSKLKRVITPFVFVVDRQHNMDQTIRFFFDDIYFVMDADGSH
jgi:hypothetical protein